IEEPAYKRRDRAQRRKTFDQCARVCCALYWCPLVSSFRRKPNGRDQVTFVGRFCETPLYRGRLTQTPYNEISLMPRIFRRSLADANGIQAKPFSVEMNAFDRRTIMPCVSQIKSTITSPN